MIKVTPQEAFKLFISWFDSKFVGKFNEKNETHANLNSAWANGWHARHNCEDKSPSPDVPPIGLRPKYIANLCRIEEISAAMRRYSEVNKSIPIEWIDELVGLINHSSFPSAELIWNHKLLSP